MVYSNTRIKRAMSEGHIVIEPFHENYLSTSSYDVCLGKFFFREQHPDHFSTLFNIYDQDEVRRIWGNYQVAESAEKVLQNYRFNWKNINKDDLVILLAPGETILGHTEEFIGGRIDITTMMKARSSAGRSFIEVCKCAGWGDVGYVNRWTMEITNVSDRHYIPLVVGERIAQIVFFEAEEAAGDYGETGNYQESKIPEYIRSYWNPDNMLPRTKRTVNNKES